MKRRKSVFPVIFVLVMLLCVLFIAWYLPTVSDLQISAWKQARDVSGNSSMNMMKPSKHSQKHGRSLPVFSLLRIRLLRKRMP